MTDTWKSEERGEIACECGAVYSVTATRYVAPHSDTFVCIECGKTLREEIGTWHYTFRLKHRPNVEAAE
jgi:hypothetical protein